QAIARFIDDRSLIDVAESLRLRRVHDVRAVAGDEREMKSDGPGVLDQLEGGEIEAELIRALRRRAGAGDEIVAGLRGPRVIAVDEAADVQGRRVRGSCRARDSEKRNGREAGSHSVYFAKSAGAAIQATRRTFRSALSGDPRSWNHARP